MYKHKLKKYSEVNKVVLYKNKNGKVELRADVENDTLLATQIQISNIFNVEVNTINYHLKEIFSSNELREKSTIRKIRIVQNEGGRTIKR